MNSRAIYAVVAILAIVISAVDASGFGFGHSLDFVRTGSSTLFSGCEGSIAECIAEEEEMEFDSDISRRILAQKKYVSYGAMRKNSVPCSRRGASYYNCQRGAQAKPLVVIRASCSLIPHLNGYISLKEHKAMPDQEKETCVQNLFQDGCFYLSTKQHLASLLQRTLHLVSYQHQQQSWEIHSSQSITKKAKESCSFCF